jgi:hypothetical protein
MEPGIIGSGVPRHDDVMAFRLSEIEASFPLRHPRGMLGHLELVESHDHSSIDEDVRES